LPVWATHVSLGRQTPEHIVWFDLMLYTHMHLTFIRQQNAHRLSGMAQVPAK